MYKTFRYALLHAYLDHKSQRLLTWFMLEKELLIVNLPLLNLILFLVRHSKDKTCTETATYRRKKTFSNNSKSRI